MSANVSFDQPLPDGRVSRIGERISWFVFWLIHLLTITAIWTGFSTRAVIIAFVLYWVRMFAITAGYHRYFSHRSFKTSRFMQFLFALVGTTCVQKGPLWWASTHRRHHRYSDTVEDVHSPLHRGFWYSHVGWVTTGDHIDTQMKWIKDFARYPELVWLGKYHFVPPVALAFLCYLIAGWSGVIVGFGWSLVLVWHWTFTVNSLAHVFGKRRFATTDTSRNNWLIAFFTMGEGWHNNHHHYQNSVNQGFYWWEFDFSYYILRAMAAVGLVWDLKRPPAHVLEKNRIDAASAEAPALPEPAPVAIPKAA
jgi:stearoyl-CoA desaturase (delta-9 desaturase)